MGFRFQKRISILPGVRINLSKSGASASLGPKGADVNIGPHGVTTNAGIPGTGLSYRSKLGTHGSWTGVALLVGALAFWAGRHYDKWSAPVHPAARAEVASPATNTAPVARHGGEALAPGTVYVRRGGSVLRDEAKWSGHPLAHKDKGAAVTLLQTGDDGWAKVQDGAVTGWMRASVLGGKP